MDQFQTEHLIKFMPLKQVNSSLLYAFYASDFSICLAEGQHTLTKTIVTSKVGKLAMFTKKRSTCIGCKAVLDDDGEDDMLKIFN